MKRLVGLVLCTLMVGGARAHATDLRDVITDITITSWNEKDGLPASTISGLVQDRDGYLWVGTRQGLFRFDGVRFLSWESVNPDPLPDRSIRAMLRSRRDEIWIGFGTNGQVARMAGGHLTAFSISGPGGGAVLSLAEGHDGTIWAGTEKGLFSFDGIQWRQATDAPSSPIVGLLVDAAGTLHVASTVGLFTREAGMPGLRPLGPYVDLYGGFAQGADGRVWVTDPRVGYHALAAPSPSGTPTLQGRGIRVLVDRKGNLWTGTGGQGLWRTRGVTSGTPIVERTSSLTGLLGDGVYALLEDRDGNIWAGTTEGLNRITPRTIEQVIDLGLVRGVGLDAHGAVWVGTVDRLFIYPDPPESRRVEVGPAPDARSLAVDARGTWVAAGSGVSHVTADGTRVPIHWAADDSAGWAEGVVPDGRHGLWLVTSRRTIVHANGQSSTIVTLPVEVRGAAITAAFVDSSDRAWFAFDNGRLAVVTRQDDVRVVGTVMAGGRVVRTMAEDPAGRVWLGGDGVLAVMDGAKMVVLPTSPRFPVVAITAIVADDRGSLWLGTSVGIVHLGRDEFMRAAADPNVTPRYASYNRSDGVAGTPVAVPFNRGGVRTKDGRVWFVTTRGITVLDPHVLEARSAPVPVRVEAVLADDRRLAPGAEIALPAGTRKLEIDYTVVNLTSPLKSRFRYRLDPFDPNWVDAGPRRQAFYTNLKPGRYVFHVAAAGVGGDASSEASWVLSVAPRFYQTTSFAAVATVGVMVLVLCGWRLRERHLRKQFALLIAERARLGREIHDTLLQGLVAIALQFDSLAHDLAPLPRLQERFLRMRDRVEEYIREARRSIWDLNTQPPHRNLVESLRRAGEFATDGRDIAFTFEVQGTPFECPSRVEEQVVRIAQEASLNSVRHAAPRRLQIALTYDDAAVTLRVADDGRGFDTQVASGAGHYGLRSMQERARSVGGALTLTTAPGQGTEVIAVLPIAS